MESIGIDYRLLLRTLAQIPRAARGLKRRKVNQAGKADISGLLSMVGLPASEGGGYADIMNLLFEDAESRQRIPELAEADPLAIFQWIRDNPIIFDWMDFKADALLEVLASARDLAKSNDPDFELGLGMWSPRSSWTICQSYSKLRDACDWMMPMVYHRLWGWYSANVADEIFQLIHPRTPKFFASYKDILRFWFKLAGYTAPPLRSRVFNGLPPKLIGKELARARSLVGPGFPLYAGVQLWEPGSRIPEPDKSAEATRISLESGVEGLVFQAYGWAAMPNMVAASRTVGELSHTRP
jgi:hypothetical protein